MMVNNVEPWRFVKLPEPELKHGKLTLETIAILRQYVPRHAKEASIARFLPTIYCPDKKPYLVIEYVYGQAPYWNVGSYHGIEDNEANDGLFTLEDLQKAWACCPKATGDISSCDEGCAINGCADYVDGKEDYEPPLGKDQ